MGRRVKFPGNRESFASGPPGSAKAGGFARVSVKFPTREQGISGARAGSGSAVSANIDIGSTVLKSRIRSIHLSNEYGDFSVAPFAAVEEAGQRKAHAVMLSGRNGVGRKSLKPASPDLIRG